MKWNLSEDLQATGKPANYFEPPLAAAIASALPFQVATDSPQPGTYTFTEVYQDLVPTTQTVDVALTITATPPSGGFPTDSSLGSVPAGAIRLHAMCRGRLRWDAQNSNLVLEMKLFESISLTAVPWWKQWTYAKRTPKFLTYENVDQASVNTLLTSIPADQPGQFGVSFPLEDGAPVADRSGFITLFFQGQRYFDVVAGAVIGAAAAPTGATNPDQRALILHASYDDSTAMSPRELFYLAFGEKSSYSVSHPLFVDMGTGIPFARTLGHGPTPVTKWGMIMRPPLRTSNRVFWEANQEATTDGFLIAQGGLPLWGSAPGCALDPNDTLFDRIFVADYGTLDGKTKGVPKCNVFIGDLSTRGGFRMPVCANSPDFRYPLAAMYANHAVLALSRQPDASLETVPLKGSNGTDWGNVLTRQLTKVDVTDSSAATNAVNKINVLAASQGCLLILAMARPRKVADSPTSCDDAFVANPGHIVFVETLTSFDHRPNSPPSDPSAKDPTDDPPANPDLVAGETRKKEANVLKNVESTVSQAASGKVGAVAHKANDKRKFGGKGGQTGDPQGFIRLQLIEALPGGDPDLLHGLSGLHVKVKSLVFLKTKLERCPKTATVGSGTCTDSWPD